MSGDACGACGAYGGVFDLQMICFLGAPWISVRCCRILLQGAESVVPSDGDDDRPEIDLLQKQMV